jgi:hypothetical protein
MKNVKALTFILMPFVATTILAANAAASSLSVSSWEQNLKSSLEAGKDITPFFDLKKIEKQTLTPVETADRKNMLEARRLYAAGKFDEALAKYNLIPKGSDYWLEAVEEKGWAYHVKNDFAKSLAQTKTLLSEPLVQIVGSEPFFLQSLSNLKICDYKNVFETDQEYKDTQKKRVAAIEQLAQTGDSPELANVINKAESFPLTFDEMGAETKTLPRLFFRDREVQKQLIQIKLTSRGVDILQARRESGAKNAASLTNIAALLQKSNAVAVKAFKARMQALAKIEDKQNRLMLQKLGLIEVETIERMHADQDLDRKSFSKGAFSKVTDDQLVFPDDGNPWMDELDKYEVSANACPRHIRRKM